MSSRIISSSLERHDVHQSLLRTPLFAGVDFGILVVEVALGVAVVFVSGLSLASIVPALVVVLAVHIPMRKLIAADPAMIAIIPATLRYGRFYPPSPPIRERSNQPKPAPSINTDV